jgi:hypothetical protein
MQVRIICSEPSLAYDGEWKKEDTPQQILEYVVAKARELDVPIHLEIEKLGIWSIAPNGKIMKGALFDCTRVRS